MAASWNRYQLLARRVRLHRGRFCLECGGSGGHRNGLSYLPDFQSRIEANSGIGFHLDVSRGEGLKASERDSELISARQQIRQIVTTSLVGQDTARDIRLRLSHCHVCARKCGAGVVGYGTDEGTIDRLTGRDVRERGKQKDQQSCAMHSHDITTPLPSHLYGK